MDRMLCRFWHWLEYDLALAVLLIGVGPIALLVCDVLAVGIPHVDAVSEMGAIV
jgi:hypothetical protein